MAYAIMVIQAIGWLLINPVIYVAVIVALLLGYVRVKRERSFFHTRLQPGYSELRTMLVEGLGYGLLISCITVGAGLVVSPVIIMYMMMATLLLLVAGALVLSPVYIMALAVVLSIVLSKTSLSISLFGVTLGDGLPSSLAPSIIIITGLLVIVEGVLLRKSATQVSPQVEKTKRGLYALTYRLRKLWFLPIGLVIPNGVLEVYAPYWPQLGLGETSFSVVIIPLFISGALTARVQLPTTALRMYGNQITALGFVIIALAIVVYNVPSSLLIILISGAIVHIILTTLAVLREQGDTYAVAPNAEGLVIAAILPQSPAEKMGLSLGECIVKVNGLPVKNEQELYAALQVNAAYCKLTVRDIRKELRYTQHAVFADDHHRVGIIAVDPYGKRS